MNAPIVIRKSDGNPDPIMATVNNSLQPVNKVSQIGPHGAK